MKKNTFLDSFEHPIRNIIFDLGGVIINVDYLKTQRAFEDLGINNFAEIFSQVMQNKIADDFETGKLSVIEFRESLRKLVPELKLSDEAIDKAWNAMLLDLPAQRLDVLDKLKTEYRIFLLSNTNAIHIDYCRAYSQLGEVEKKFEKIYLSHEIHLRKPNIEAYQFVLDDAGLNPEDTLFIDDTLQNIEGARLAGLNVYHLTNGECITDIFEL